MEGLGVAASIIAVLQISEQVLSACYQYYRAAKGAKSDIVQVINNVGGLKTTLENLRPLIDIAGGPADQPDPRLPHLAASVKSCQEALQTIERKLRITPTVNLNLADVKVGLVKHLTWPWKEKEVEKLLGVIEKQKTIFILALSGDTLETVLSIQDTVEGVRNTTASIHGVVEGVRSTALSIQETVGGVRNSVDTAAITERHAKILNWIKLSDPSSNHNAARKKHQPTTGTWFLESEQFVSWMEGRITSIWIHGIPGAGKTILSSTVIDHVDAVCKLDSAQQYAYFYFDFNDANKRTVNGMLRSMIQQLSILTLFPEVDKLYHHCGEGTHEPGQEVLVETLVSLFQHSDRTFLIVDALDECSDSERDDLLDVITKITQAQRVGLLATSRNERDIARSLKRTVENVTSLPESDGIADDISLHVQKCLQEDSRLREWPLTIKEEIQLALTKGAHGMFRWVECQLNALRKCLTVSAVRSALRNLPRTLDDTYERILNSIPQEYQKEAHCAFQLLTVSYTPLTLVQVAEAIAVDCESEIFNPENRLREPEALLEICSSLLSLSGNELRFAHYSVQEYLVSARISQGTSSNFAVVDTHAHRLFAKVSLIYLLSVIENDTKSRASILTDYEDVDDDASPRHWMNSNHDMDAIVPYATHFWLDHFHHARIELFHAPEWILTKRLFDPVSHCTFFRICSTHFIFVDYNYNTLIGHESESKPGDRLYHASFLGFTELVEWLLQEGGNPNASSGGSCTYPLIVAAAEGHEAVIGLLLDSGAEVDARDIRCNRTALYWAVRQGHEATMRLLLNRGAVFDDGFKFTTPLHEAAIGGHESLVRMLIQAGEDVNKQGGEYGYPLQAAASSCNLRIVRLLLENGALVIAEGGKYGSALQAAAYSGRVEIVRFLLEKGADINAEGGEYGCALQAAAAGYRSRIPWLAQRQDCVEVAQLLLDKGANVNAKGGKYGSALRAAKDGHFEDMVLLLLENGARD